MLRETSQRSSCHIIINVNVGYSGGLDGLASSRNLKCIWYLAFNLPNSHLIAGKRMQLLRRLC